MTSRMTWEHRARIAGYGEERMCEKMHNVIWAIICTVSHTARFFGSCLVDVRVSSSNSNCTRGEKSVRTSHSNYGR